MKFDVIYTSYLTITHVCQAEGFDKYIFCSKTVHDCCVMCDFQKEMAKIEFSVFEIL